MLQHERKTFHSEGAAAGIGPEPPDEHRAVTWTQTVLSGLAAAVGVQNSASRERDFASGSPIRFAVVGIVLTALLIGMLLLLVTSLVP